MDLIEENFEYNHAKTKGSRIIERVDRRVYGGGYGIGEEWLRLFNSLTILYSKKVITKNDLLFMLNTIKCGRKSKLDSVSFLGDGIRNVIINENYDGGSINGDWNIVKIPALTNKGGRTWSVDFNVNFEFLIDRQQVGSNFK
jgi:hypothetical protein